MKFTKVKWNPGCICPGEVFRSKSIRILRSKTILTTYLISGKYNDKIVQKRKNIVQYYQL